MRSALVIYLLVIIYFIKGTFGQCSIPSYLANFRWWDSDKGLLEFNDTHVTGWGFLTPDTGTGVIDTWSCLDTHEDDGDTFLIVKATKPFSLLSKYYRTYLCMNITRLSDSFYKYYLMFADLQTSYSDGERITYHFDSHNVTDPKSELCLPWGDANSPLEHEYHLLVKEGQEDSTKTNCHSDFYGVYSYNITDQDNSMTYCGQGNETWDVCTDRSIMTFNYSICNTPVAYSANGSVFCVYSSTVSGNSVQTVYNNDNTVGETFGNHRFTCMMTSLGTDGSLSVSQSIGSCTKTQTPSTQPTLVNGTVNGLNMMLTPHRLCPIETTDEEEDTGLSDAAIAGIVIGSLVFIALVLLGIILACKYLTCCRTCTPRDKEPDSSKPRSSLLCGCCNDRKNKKGKEQSPIISPRGITYGLHRTLSNITEEDEEIACMKNGSSSARSIATSNIVSPKTNDMSDDLTTFAPLSAVQERNAETKSNGSFKSEEQRNNDDENGKNVLFTSIRELETSASGDESTVQVFTGNNEPTDTKNEEIEITRVVQNEHFLRKDMPHLNSTENLLSGYDAAMSYGVGKYSVLKSDASLHKSGADELSPVTIKKNIVKPFEYTCDDSEIETKTESKREAGRKLDKRIYKSEANLVESVNKSNLKRTSSLKSSLFCGGSIEWNFYYISPYGLSMTEKEEMLARKVRLERKRKRTQRKAREEKEKRQRENQEAFERWKQRKREEKITANTNITEMPAKEKLYRYKTWFP